jgi:hypothetical protein
LLVRLPPSARVLLALGLPAALLLQTLLALAAAPALQAAPLSREAVPEPLRPWVDWVLRGHEAETCPFLHASGARDCVWPARLELDLHAAGGRFVQELYVAAESDVPLPGGSAEPAAWPEDVSVDGRPAPVLDREGRPALRLGRGVHRVRGRLVWSALPPLLSVPRETGIVALRLDGRPVPFPKRDAAGRLWLRGTQPGAGAREAEDRVEVDVHRRVVDEVPLRLDTAVRLRVSGAAREERLGRALPDGFAPTLLAGPLPARLDPDGRLRVQVRPGRWLLRIDARHEGPAAALGLPAQPEGATWDASEVWAVETRPALRLVEIEGAPPVDPTQTELPEEWKRLPAYRLDPGGALRLVEKRRGTEGGAADRLSLKRTWHLDFDGAGATVADRIEGELREATRLEMGAGTKLGRAAVNGADQPVTRRAGAQVVGVEVPLGPVAIDADSRVEGGVRRLPAVGWDHDFDAVSATLALPPGWRLLHASGVDHAAPTWIARWTLLDLFVVMVVAMATLRLFGRGPGALALATLALTYTEPGAPRMLWLAVLAAEALHRVVPRGRLATAVRAIRAVSLALLVLAAVPFAVAQVRAGLFPALERPRLAAVPVSGIRAALAPAAPEAPVADEFAEDIVVGTEEIAPETIVKERVIVEEKGLPRREAVRRDLPMAAPPPAETGARAYAPDPSAKVPTGPGRPDWRWEEVQLAWSGPVERGQALGLWLLPPWLSGTLALVRTALLAALVLLVLGSERRRLAGRLGGATRAPAVACVASALALSLAPGPARAEFPTPELLRDLRERLLEPPSCYPVCASASRLVLGVTPERLELRLAVDVAVETGIPLPSGGDGEEAGFAPDAVAVDGRAAEAILRGSGGELWLRLAPGSHELLLSGRLPARPTVEIPLPLRPQRVELAAPPRGWTVLGLQPDGRSPAALQLARDAAPAPQSGGGGGRLEPTAIPTFVTVERTLLLGLDWQVETTFARVAPPEGAIVLEVPLLPGEAVTTPGVRVRDGRALATLAPGAAQARWTSLLATREALELEAPREVSWTEVWRLDASPIWHVSAQGIPPVDVPSAGRRFREWRPWPGERIALAVEKPEGTGGETLTIDRSELRLRPGVRATDATLALVLRSSQGGQHFVTLPEGAELTRLAVGGVEQPIRQEGRRVPIPLAPGSRAVELAWREPRGIGAWLRGPEVDLGLPSVNAHATVEVPPSRWVLFLGGPRLGPSVLFWPILVVVAGLALALGRVSWTPLRARHWFGLGVGLTQAPLPAAALVVVWLLALGWRGRLSEVERTRSGLGFDGLQILLAAATLAALGALALAIQMGLLGTPAMQIAGNGSEYGVLRWYQDRAGAVLPRPWVLSVSLWLYRGAMLAWSLWVAQALLGWLRWGFRQWSAGGTWIRLRAPRALPGT